MNREIKFKARNNKCWIYCDAIINGWAILNENGGMAKINPETVGQYTGLHDKNGKEIYEGDILKSIKWNDIYLVKYIGTAFYLCRKGNNGFNKITTWNNAEKSEIIGNITDNLELLGGE